MAAWGEFEDMAVHYLRELAKRSDETPIFIRNVMGPVYGVCNYNEFVAIIEQDKRETYRLVCSTSADEFMGLLFARYLDFAKEEEDDNKQKDISTGELFGSEPAAVDAGGARDEKGGHGEDSGGREEEDNNRKVH